MRKEIKRLAHHPVRQVRTYYRCLNLSWGITILNIRTLLFPLVLAIWLLGCAATGEVFKPTHVEPGMSLIYIFHVYNPFAGWGSYEDIYIDGNKTVELPGGGYFAVAVPPGKHVVSARRPPPRREIVIEVFTLPDRPSYVRVRKEVGFYVIVKTWTTYIEVIDESIGHLEISQTRLQQPWKE